MKLIGRALLIEHDGRPVEWPIHRSELPDSEHLEATFTRLVKMCSYELHLGGTLRVTDIDGNLIREQRGKTGEST